MADVRQGRSMSRISFAPDGFEASGERMALSRLANVFLRWLTIAAIASFFLISPLMLYDLGFNYAGAGGNIFEKVHPGTWMLLLALLLKAIGGGNPLGMMDDFVKSRALVIYLLGLAALFGYTILARGTPFTPWIDTYLMPALIYVAITNMSARDIRTMAVSIQVLLFANALLGLYESLTGYRFSTYVAGEFLIDQDWRATALLGHPLANALATGSYVIILALGGGRDLPKVLRALMLLLQLLAMTAFGGRSSLVISLLIVVAIGLFRMVRFCMGARVDFRQLGLTLLTVPFFGAALALVANAGFFDRMAQRFIEDNGSAKARIVMLQMFDTFSWEDLLIGPDPERIGTLQYMMGIEYGIESFWIAFIVGNGLLISFVFFPALACFCWRIVAVTRPATIILFLYFFTLATSSVSISAKTVALGLLVAMVMTMLRPGPLSGGTDSQSLRSGSF